MRSARITFREQLRDIMRVASLHSHSPATRTHRATSRAPPPFCSILTERHSPDAPDSAARKNLSARRLLWNRR